MTTYLITVQNIELIPIAKRIRLIKKNSLCLSSFIFFSKTPSQDKYLIDFIPSITSVVREIRLSFCYRIALNAKIIKKTKKRLVNIATTTT